MKTLYIMRGLPGSGKTTQAHKLLNYFNSSLCHYSSADLFHISPFSGCYEWKPENVPYAHEYCRLDVRRAMIWQYEVIIVDNTNIKKKDFQAYLEMAEKYAYEVKYIISDAPWAWNVEKCFKRNKHNVPFEVIQRMKDTFETVF